MREFAVVDLETTGVFPKVDRIIEIAAVRADERGKVHEEYTTLINPQRDLEPTHVHGITAAQVLNAPEFQEVVGDVLTLLKGAVFVAHNAAFDARFLRAELSRSGHELPELPTVCTMRLARKADPEIPGRSLRVLCEHFNVSYPQAHCAVHDVRATAELLFRCLKELEDPIDALLASGVESNESSWPSLPRSGRAYPRAVATTELQLQPSYITRLLDRLPATIASDEELEEYLSVLDRVLEDRRITADEAEELLTLAYELGILREQALAAHKAYMRQLVRAAFRDGVITESERRDLDDVRRLLNVSERDCRSIESEVTAEKAESSRVDVHDFEGKSVCFTGTLTCRRNGERITRDVAERVAQENGMEVRKSVTKDLDYLVAADPDSMSAKARNARKFGVRIVAEPVFFQMLGVDLE